MSEPARAAMIGRPRRRRRLLLGLVALPLVAYVVAVVVRRAQLAEGERRQARAEEAIKRLGGQVQHYPDGWTLDPFVRREAMVYLWGAEVGDDDLALLDGFPPGRLTQLYLGRTRITDAGLARIARHSGLRVLQIGRNDPPPGEADRPEAAITDAGLAQLKALPRLQILALCGVPITDGGLKHFPRWRNLYNLSLARTGITDAGLSRLAETLPNLNSLDLSGCAITDAGARHLARLQQIQQIFSLDLSDTAIGDDGLAALGGLTGLRRLLLNGTRVRGDGLAHLAALPRLEALQLDGSAVDDEGLAILARSGSLRRLSLRDTKVTDAGLDHLAGMVNLESLEITGARTTAAGQGRLAKARPGIGISTHSPR